MGDTFHDFSVPAHLTTIEFHRQLDELLADDGLYLLNLIDTLESGRFLGAMIRTCRAVFPHVTVFAVHPGERSRNTFVLVASKAPIDLTGVCETIQRKVPFAGRELPASRLDALARRGGSAPLTDDFAPVEHLLAPVMRDKSPPRPPDPELLSLQRQFDAKQFDEFEKSARERLDRVPESVILHYLLGEIAASRGDYVKAREEFRAELRRNPTHHQSLLGVARTCQALGDEDAALREYETAIERRPGYVTFHIERARLLHQGGRNDEAARVFESAYRLVPDFPGLRHDLGVARLLAGEAALEMFDAGLSDTPDDAELHNQRGRALAALGEPERAATAFRRAVALAPEKLSWRNGARHRFSTR